MHAGQSSGGHLRSGPGVEHGVIGSHVMQAAWLPTFRGSGNHGRCILYQQLWFLHNFDTNGQVSKYRRGYGLHGPEFLCNFQGKVCTCCCVPPLCKKIGYLHKGMIQLPLTLEDAAGALRVLGLPTGARLRVLDNPRGFMIVLWHYHFRYYVRDKRGNWRLRKEATYMDTNDETFSFALPNANV